MERTKRNELEFKLLKYFPIISTNREMLDNIKKYYIEKNIDSSVPMRIINKESNLTLLTDVDLCMLTSSINMTPNEYGLDTNFYFTKSDRELARTYKKDKIKEDNVVVFRDVSTSKFREGVFMCNEFTFPELNELSNIKRLGYNFATQREGKKIVKGSDIVTIPMVSKKHVLDIKDSWKLGTFIPNTLTFNLKHIKQLTYDPINRNLKVVFDENGRCDVADGYHRTVAALDIIQHDPTFPTGFYYIRLLADFTDEQVQNFIRQEDKHTPINKEHIQLMNNEDINIQITKFINDYGSAKTNLLFHKFAIKAEEIIKENKYCLYSNISYPLNIFFKVNDMDMNDVKEVKGLLLRGLSYILSLVAKKSKNDKKYEAATYNYMFVFYIALLEELYEVGYHKQVEISDANKLENALKNILNKIDFSIDNPKWKELNIVNKNNKMVIKKVNLAECNKIAEYAFDCVEAEVDKDGK